ncbi:ribosome maturation factor RimP [Nitratidesulfovibrio liaohensis]|uniref:ribosome maturation factor RimP n=1 Tax=Nitratidesulfovibrio liaohensis TaxID=2604158 RepID=UPI001421DD23|nr:ribosome maturation factor RimP [Nitratidesulfovibrio liaohensis]NHZ46512.1 ribosome maturation factor RimP [Nitratidesulfovibrio liaohensis]
MSTHPLRDAVAAIATPLADALGIALWGIEIIDGGRTVLRVYVDVKPGMPAPEAAAPETAAPDGEATEDIAPERVTIDQCARLSRQLGLALDVEDVVRDAYVLEVSSPGLERPFFEIAQIAPYVGRTIELTLAVPHPEWPGRRKFRADIVRVEGDTLTFLPDTAPRPDEDPAPISVAWDDVKKAHLIHIFPDTTRPQPGGKSGQRKKAQPKKPARGGAPHDDTTD